MKKFGRKVPEMPGAQAAINMRYSPITYTSVLGEPLHVEVMNLGFIDYSSLLHFEKFLSYKLGYFGLLKHVS